MLGLAALCCALVCFAGGLASGGTRPDARPDPRAVLLTVVQIVGGAGLGWLIGWLMSLTPAETAALALIGAAPGTVAVNPLVTLSGGDLTLTRAITAIGGLAGVAAVAVVAWLAGEGGRGSTLYLLILAAAVPAFAGAWLTDRVPPAIHRLAPIAAGLALAVLILAGLLIGPAGATFWPLIPAALLLAVALLLLGQGTATALRLGAPAATTAALALPMRNIAVPMLAGLAAGLTATPLAGALYGILMYLPPLALVITRAARR